MMNMHNNAGTTVDPIMSNLTNEDINKIIRGEMSAVESYEQVLEKVNKDPKATRLKQFKKDHEKAVSFWKSEVRFEGKIPEHTSGVWGKVTEAFVGTSKLMGNKTALKAIKNGEEHGLKVYEEMLESDKLTPFQKTKIRNTFIPMQRNHIDSVIAIEKAE